MSGLELTAGLALTIAALGFAGRAHLLGARGRGWPSAPVALRAGLWAAAAACAARAMDLWRGGWIEAADVALSLVLAAYAAVALVNLARQRARRSGPAARGVPYGREGAELFVPSPAARDPGEPPAWPGPYF